MATVHKIGIDLANQTHDNGLVKTTRKVKFSPKEVRQAAVVLGTSSWQARSARFTPEQLSVQLSAAGKLGGRPRKVRI
jgi:hypothetical protein